MPPRPLGVVTRRNFGVGKDNWPMVSIMALRTLPARSGLRLAALNQTWKGERTAFLTNLPPGARHAISAQEADVMPGARRKNSARADVKAPVRPPKRRARRAASPRDAPGKCRAPPRRRLARPTRRACR